MTRSNPSDTGGPVDPDAAGRPFFSARLTPYRSLGASGFFALMIATGGLCFVSGILFLVVGAWPVFFFLGLDVLVLWVAFRLSYSQARAFEEVHVSALDVHLVRVGAKGGVEEFHVNPAWARLEVERVEDEGVVGLRLRAHGRALDIGRFLNPPDRESFAAALGRALATARRGGPGAMGPVV